MDGLQDENVAVPPEQLEEDELAVADKENCEQNLDNYDVGRLWRGRSNCAGSSLHLVVENDCMVEKSVLLVYGMGPLRCPEMVHKIGFHNRGVQWDTPMARWAGEGNDWIKLVAQQNHRKQDVIRSLLETEPNGIRPAEKPRDLPPLELGIPETGQWPTLEMEGIVERLWTG